MNEVKVFGEDMVILLLARLGLCEIKNIHISGENSLQIVCKVKREEPFELLNLMPLDKCPNFSNFRVEDNNGLKTVSFSYEAIHYDYGNDCLTMDLTDFSCVVKMFFENLFGEDNVEEVILGSLDCPTEYYTTVKSVDNEPLLIDGNIMRTMLMTGLRISILSVEDDMYDLMVSYC